VQRLHVRHTVWALAVHAVNENVFAMSLHAAQLSHTRSLVGVAAASSYVPVLGSQAGVSATHVRSLRSVGATDCHSSDAHTVSGAHRRSLIGVGAAVSYCVLATHSVTAEH